MLMFFICTPDYGKLKENRRALLFRDRAFSGPRFEESRRGVRTGRRQRSAGRTSEMALYEHVFLARQDLAQAQVDALAATATNIIETGGGKVVKTETWGLRSLAYRIAKNRKAHYVMLEFEAPGAVVAELE